MKKKMYSLLLLLGILCSATLRAQVTAEPDSVIVGRYFETIRQDEIGCGSSLHRCPRAATCTTT